MMKRMLFWALLAFFALSCTREPAVDEALSEETCTIRATLDRTTRFAVDEGGKATWEAGDEIGVFLGGKICKFTLSEGAGTTQGVFSGELVNRGKAMDGVAVYPYDPSLKLNGKSVEVLIPEAGTDDKAFPSPMVATLTAQDIFRFRHVAGMLRVQYRNLRGDAYSVRITGSNTLAGTFTLADYSISSLTVPATTAHNVITAQLPFSRPGYAAYVDIPVPTGTLSSVKAELLDATGKVLHTQSSTSAKTFTPGYIQPLTPVEVPGTQLNVEWVWDGGSTVRFDGNMPAIDAAGNVYVMAGSNLYKIGSNGSRLWSFALNGLAGANEGSPSLEPDGSVVYAAGGSTHGVLYAVNADGSLKWNFNDWGPLETHAFAQTLVAVGTGSNIYVPCNWPGHSGDGRDNGTVLSISKATGARVSYLAYNEATSPLFLGTASGSIAVSKQGEVAYASRRGAFTMHQADLDNPRYTHSTYGGYTRFSYRDQFGTWSYFGGSISQGVICGKKADSGKDVLISCQQRAARQMLVTCSDATEIKNLNEATDNETYRAPNDALRHYYWRYAFGSHGDSGDDQFDPGMQTRGGIVLGHDNLVVLLPLQAAPAGQTNKMWGPAGVHAVFVQRGAAKEDNSLQIAGTATVNPIGKMRDWRFNIRDNVSGETLTHSVEPHPGVSGAPAVDNNGWVHVASDDCYHILNAPAKESGEGPQMYTGIETKVKASWVDLLNASGKLDYSVTTVDAPSSVKLGANGRMYVNLNVNGSRGVTVCLSYPGVTGPDTTSSWPQKGADQYNSCNQQR